MDDTEKKAAVILDVDGVLNSINNLIKVYEKGTYILSNYNYSYLGIFGFPKGKVSLKGVKYEVCDYELDFVETKAISNEFSDLKARLDVLKGSILLVLSKDK